MPIEDGFAGRLGTFMLTWTPRIVLQALMPTSRFLMLFEIMTAPSGSRLPSNRGGLERLTCCDETGADAGLVAEADLEADGPLDDE